nr:NPCBM/NEW2 domain-containing protein [Gandjariella thermophila]
MLVAATFVTLSTTLIPTASALENGLARTPQMGFNNWNATHCRSDFNEAMVKSIADIFVSSGLRAAGYQYVNIDDCWALPQRDTSGNLVPDPARFPHGIKALADYVHSKGLKFGLYSSAGTKTCDSAGFPGALGHERQDAALWASWGVDYLKYDNCNNQGVDARQRYTAMRDALAATGRPILFSICEWGQNQPWTWAQNVGNSWRTTGDIGDNWATMLSIFQKNLPLARYARPGAWNDPDMLEVGNGGMTDTEYRSHFSLWAMMAAPLLIGTDLRKAGSATLDILTNRDVIAVDQDPLGIQGQQVSAAGGRYVVAKPLANGDVAVGLFNAGEGTATISTTAAAIGLGNAHRYRLQDLWSRSSRTTTGAISASVPAHGTVVYRVSRLGATPAPSAGTSQLSALPWALMSNAWGPAERDRSNGEAPDGDGRTLTVGGVTFVHGLGTNARSEIRYDLGSRCTRFTASVGVDDEVGDRGSVVFQVYADGRKVADSGLLRGTDGVRQISADVSGAALLHLTVLDGGDTADYDHADWGNATITCA